MYLEFYYHISNFKFLQHFAAKFRPNVFLIRTILVVLTSVPAPIYFLYQSNLQVTTKLSWIVIKILPAIILPFKHFCLWDKILSLPFKTFIPPTRERESEVAQLCPNLCDPMECTLPGSSFHGIFPAKVLEWVTISFSRVSSWHRDRTQVSCILGRRFNL